VTSIFVPPCSLMRQETRDLSINIGLSTSVEVYVASSSFRCCSVQSISDARASQSHVQKSRRRCRRLVTTVPT